MTSISQREINFHSQVMMDHALFLHLGLQDVSLKDQAFVHYSQWEEFIRGGGLGDILPLVEQLREFKLLVLERLHAKEWIGWLSSSFVEYILEKLLIFQLLLGGNDPPPQIQAVQNLKLLRDYIEDAESKLDPREVIFKREARQLRDQIPLSIRELVIAPGDLLEQYEQVTGTLSPTADVQLLTIRFAQQIDSYLSKLQDQKPFSVIHPILLDYWLRGVRRVIEG